MKSKLPPLNAVHAFEAAARHRSFARAALELNVTPAAVSHHVKQLEQWLGAALFMREANGVVLSAAGREYAARVRELLEKLSQTSVTLRAGNKRTTVTLRAQFSIATLWLLPRVIAFNQSQTEIELRLSADMDRPSAKLSADLAIYFERTIGKNQQQDWLLGGSFRLYGAPALLNGAHTASSLTAKSLLSLPFIHVTPTEREWLFPTAIDWLLEAGVELPASEPLAGFHVNLEHMAATACIQGAGLALLLDSVSADAIRAGSLVALPGPALSTPHPYFLVSRRDCNDAVAQVRDWLVGEAALAA